MGIQAMKTTANAKLLHCVTVGCTTVGQIEDDVYVAQQFRPLSEDELSKLRDRGKELAGPGLENWKRNIQTASLSLPRYTGS